MSILSANDPEFNSVVLRATQPVLVDFWADWCGPCRVIAPILDEIAEEYAGRLLVVKTNVDLSPEAAQAYRIRSIPTLVVFRGGAVIGLRGGMVRKTDIVQFIEKTLAS